MRSGRLAIVTAGGASRPTGEMRMQNIVRDLTFAGLLLLSPRPPAVCAQQVDSARVIGVPHAHEASAMRPVAVTRLVRRDSTSRPAHVAHYALAGGGIGAGMGFLVAFVLVL